MVSNILIGENQLTNIISAQFNDTLNEINTAEINVTGQNTFESNLFTIGAIITFEAPNKDYKFKIKKIAYTEQNSIKLICRGIEEIMANQDIDLSSLSNASSTNTRAGVYNSITAANILSDLASQISGWSISTSISETVANFRVNDSDSVLNALGRLCTQQGYEFDINYGTQTINVENDLGSSQVDTLNEGIDFEGMPLLTLEEGVKRVIVLGKGDGNNQIKATASAAGYTTGDPTKKINDPNAISISQAQKRADIELARVENDIEHYNIPTIRNKTYRVSDTILVNSQSVGLSDKELKVVSIINLIQGNVEVQNIEVTNAEHSRAFKSGTRKLNEQALISRDNSMSQQGSGNTQNFKGEVNGTSTAPLRIPINIDSSFQDEAGNLRINEILMSVDVDKFRKSAGTATATSDLQVDGTSANESPLVENDSGSTSPSVSGATAETDVAAVSTSYRGANTSSSVSLTGSFQEIETVDILEDCSFVIYQVELEIDTALQNSDGICVLEFKIGLNSSTARDTFQLVNPKTGTFNKTGIFSFSGNTTNDELRLYARELEGGGVLGAGTSLGYNGILQDHDHNDGSLSASNHSHSDGSYQAANHGHSDGSLEVPISELSSITIGDDVSDAASVNATGFSWELREVVAGVSTVRNSGSSTFSGGVTFINDIDISSSGTYPNSTNQWQLFVYTNNATADLIKAQVKIKHNLDNS